MFGQGEEVVQGVQGRESTSPSPSASSSEHSDLSDDEAQEREAHHNADAMHATPVKKSVSNHRL